MAPGVKCGASVECKQRAHSTIHPHPSSTFERFFSLLGVDLWLGAADKQSFRLGKGCRESQSGLPTPRLTSLPCAVPRSHEGQYLGGIEAADSSDNHCVVRERGE
jgi:hypothetical protein